MYASAFFLNWLATQVASRTLTVFLHTGEPGNGGTLNQAVDNAGDALETTIAAANMSASGAAADNDAAIKVFTPDATRAGQVITHMSYWFGSDFLGWAELDRSHTTAEGVPVQIPAGAVDLMFQLGAAS